MSTIRGYSQSNYYDSADNDYSAYNQNASSFLAGLSINSGSNNNNGIMGGINLSDYASIKNGSYRKLVKAYYAKQKADNASSGKDSSAKLTSMGSMSGTLAKSADALMKDSLWEKKEIKTKDEKTGEETTKEDYDWDSITKAVKSLVDNYNKTIESAENSNTKDVLRNAAWLTKTTKSTERLLEKVGITIGADNKLELDEDALKKADMSTLKSVFTGYNSFASKVYDKAQSISNAAARAGGTYISTTDKDGNKVMDKMSKGETMKAVNDISKQYGDNVIVEFSGDGMAALADHKQLHDLPESHKEIPDWMLTQNEGPQNLTKEELAEMQGSKEGTDMEAIMLQMDPNAYKEYQSAKADGMEKGGAEGITAGFRYMYNWVTSNAKNDSHWMDSYDPDKKQEADFEIDLTDKLKGSQHS